VHVKQLAQGCYVVAHRPGGGANPRPSDHEADALPSIMLRRYDELYIGALALVA